MQRFRSLKLYSLSASFTSLAPGLLWGACSTCCRFLSSLGRVLSSVTSSTKRRTWAPKCSSTSSRVVSVSSTVSWSRAAWGEAPVQSGGTSLLLVKGHLLFNSAPNSHTSLLAEKGKVTCNTTMSVIPASWVSIRATPDWGKTEVRLEEATLESQA